jgi:predicted MFS family arabinose efflux permease
VPIEQIAWYMFVQGVAGVAGTLTAGFVMDRFGPARVLSVYLAAASGGIAAVALADLDPFATTLAFVVAVYFSNGGLSGLNAFASISYPSQVRATGVSWAHGAGRAGAMIGPILGGAMIARDMGVSWVFLVTAIPQMCAALAIVGVWRGQSQRSGAAAPVSRQA